jgi:FtsH-binding integral membrane protein
MKTNLLFPALGIIIAGTSLVLINEFTPLEFVGPYGYILIVAAMIAGFGISRRINRSRKHPS